MPPSSFENSVNLARGHATLYITAASCYLVLSKPTCLLFWTEDGYALNVAKTGVLGLATSAVFLIYLLIDTLVGIVCRHKFRRPMTAVIIHHLVVGIGVAAFLMPAPPRGFFLYVWGEALTACRLLPLEPRYHARNLVFACRRLLWCYLLARDVCFFGATRERYGVIGASVPPLVAILLLGLDEMWWREHARSRAGGRHKRAPSDGDATRPTMMMVDVEAAHAFTEDEQSNEHGRLLKPPAEHAGAAERAPSALANGNAAAARCSPHRGVAQQQHAGAPPRSLDLEAEMRPALSFDDLQIHTP